MFTTRGGGPSAMLVLCCVLLAAVVPFGSGVQHEGDTNLPLPGQDKVDQPSFSVGNSSSGTDSAEKGYLQAPVNTTTNKNKNNNNNKQHRSASLSPAAHLEPDVQCSGLLSKRYISDGFCRTVKPISETLCTGFCVPSRALHDYAEFVRAWSVRGTSNRREQHAAGSSSEYDLTTGGGGGGGGTGGGATSSLGYRCVDGVVRQQRVRLVCDNGDTKTYRVRVVKSCACSSGSVSESGGFRGRSRHFRRSLSSSSIVESPMNDDDDDDDALLPVRRTAKGSNARHRRRPHPGSTDDDDVIVEQQSIG